jgi:hypothetical protein
MSVITWRACCCLQAQGLNACIACRAAYFRHQRPPAAVTDLYMPARVVDGLAALFGQQQAHAVQQYLLCM